MKVASLRILPLYTRTVLSYPRTKANLFPFVSTVRSGLRIFSSDSQFPSESSISPPREHNNSNEDVEDISGQELKRRIAKLHEGDESVIPSIFEAILKRKLAGVSDDDDILKELRRDAPVKDLKEEDFEFDSESDDDKGR